VEGVGVREKQGFRGEKSAGVTVKAI